MILPLDPMDIAGTVAGKIALLEDALSGDFDLLQRGALSAELAELTDNAVVLGAERVSAALRQLQDGPAEADAQVYWRLLRELKGLHRALQPAADADEEERHADA